VDGVLADLGFSSMQLIKGREDFRSRGRSARHADGHCQRRTTADEIVNRWSEKELPTCLYREADEHDSRRIAKAIVRARPLRDTAHLATTCGRGSKAMGKAETASRNKNVSGAADSGEIERWRNSGSFFLGPPPAMNSGGRWVVLSYHSREDRLVKHAFQEGERAGTLHVLTKHVIQPW